MYVLLSTFKWMLSGTARVFEVSQWGRNLHWVASKIVIRRGIFLSKSSKTESEKRQLLNFMYSENATKCEKST